MSEKTPPSSISGSTLCFLIAAVFLSVFSVLFRSENDAASSMFYHATFICAGIAFFQMLPSWIYAMFFEVLALLTVFFIGIFRIRRFAEPRIGKGSKTPVLLIHGYFNDAGVWFYMRKRLSKVYAGPIFALSLKSSFKSIETHAATLQKKISEIAKECNTQKIILIGHSMGGLVASFYVLEYRAQKTVEKIITIGTPFRGSYAALLAIGQNGRQMRHGSSFISELSKMLEDTDLPIFQIRSLTDELVTPSSAFLQKSSFERQYTLTNVGHAAMLFSPRVALKISSWLNQSERFHQ